MSDELVAAIVGAIVGGVIAIAGGVAQVFLQNWTRERGRVTCDCSNFRFIYTVIARSRVQERPSEQEFSDWFTPVAASGSSSSGVWELRHAWLWPHVEGDSWDGSRRIRINSVRYHAVVSLYSHKDIEVGLMRLSVAFSRGKKPLVQQLPFTWGAGARGQAFEAIVLPPKDVITLTLRGDLEKEEARQLPHCDRVELIGHLASGEQVR